VQLRKQSGSSSVAPLRRCAAAKHPEEKEREAERQRARERWHTHTHNSNIDDDDEREREREAMSVRVDEWRRPEAKAGATSSSIGRRRR
jgi:hypothetical protein